MKTAYSYTTLRYKHDLCTDEFVNVGVVLETKNSERIFRRAVDLSRATRFFVGLNERDLDTLLNHVSHLLKDLDLDAMERHYWFSEDAGFQFSKKGYGICDEGKIEETADRLFHRLVTRYNSV